MRGCSHEKAMEKTSNVSVHVQIVNVLHFANTPLSLTYWYSVILGQSPPGCVHILAACKLETIPNFSIHLTENTSCGQNPCEHRLPEQ